MVASTRTDIQTRITDQIIAQLEQGVRPWARPWNAEHAAGRIAPRRVAPEKPITARVRLRPPAEPGSMPPVVRRDEPMLPAVIQACPEIRQDVRTPPRTGYRQKIARTQRQRHRQLSLF